MEAVDASIALIGVGENNKFGHPNENVLDRLEQNGTKIYRTDEMGEICINTEGSGDIKINKFIKVIARIFY